MIALIFGTAALCALGYLTLRFTRDVIFAWYCVLGWSFLTILGLDLSSNAASIRLDPGDIINFALLLAGIARFIPRLKQGGSIRFVCIGYVLIFALSVVRGMLEYNPISVSNQVRSFLPTVLAMLYFTTVPGDDETIRKLVKTYLLFGGVLVLAMILHYAGVPIGNDTEAQSLSGEANRALRASAAGVIALCFFISLGWLAHRKSPRWMVYVPPIFASSAIILQHRTVWNILLVGLALIPFIDFALLRKVSTAVVATVIIGGLLSIFLFGSSREASRSLELSSTDTGTLEWRYGIWTHLVFEPGQPLSWIVAGRPVGTSILVFQEQFGVYGEVPPHSEYVTEYVFTGIAGVLFFLMFIFSPFSRLLQRNRNQRLSIFPSTSTWMLVIAGIFIFGITYTIDQSAIVWLGVVNAMLLRSSENSNTVLLDAQSDPVDTLYTTS